MAIGNTIKEVCTTIVANERVTAAARNRICTLAMMKKVLNPMNAVAVCQRYLQAAWLHCTADDQRFFMYATNKCCEECRSCLACWHVLWIELTAVQTCREYVYSLLLGELYPQSSTATILLAPSCKKIAPEWQLR